jgi:riboflavin synthase
MFTGIVEAIGIVRQIKKESANLRITVQAAFANELKVDQSVCHNGICLTVTNIQGDEYQVIAIEETLLKTNLSRLKQGDEINLERSMRLSDRLDGHLVQGHVDETAVCKYIEDKNGSWLFTFEYSASSPNVTVEKGSVCVNGTSLTVVESGKNWFSVAIIPYTFEHTNFHLMKTGDFVNLEFDIVGKYVARLMGERF